MGRWIIIIFCLSLPTFGLANDWDALKRPGAIAIMRHALAPGGGDPANFDITSCSTQRNLDDRGRAQARRIGEALRARDIKFFQVWTSQWCRCRDTAHMLGVAPAQDEPALNSFFQDRSTGAAQTTRISQLLRAHEFGRLMLVTHQVNITALTGVFPQSGEIIVIEMRENGVEVTGRIRMDP